MCFKFHIYKKKKLTFNPSETTLLFYKFTMFNFYFGEKHNKYYFISDN